MFLAVGAALVVWSVRSQPRWKMGRPSSSVTGAWSPPSSSAALSSSGSRGQPSPTTTTMFSSRRRSPANPCHSAFGGGQDGISTPPTRIRCLVLGVLFADLLLRVHCLAARHHLCAAERGARRAVGGVANFGLCGGSFLQRRCDHLRRSGLSRAERRLLPAHLHRGGSAIRRARRSQHGRCPPLSADRVYYKEPGFLLIATFALIRLVIATRGSGRTLAIDLRRLLELGLAAGELWVFCDHSRFSSQVPTTHTCGTRPSVRSSTLGPVPSHRPSPRRTSDLSRVPRRQVASRTPDRFTVGSAGRRRCRVLPGTRGERPRGRQIHGAGRCHRSDVRHP